MEHLKKHQSEKKDRSIKKTYKHLKKKWLDLSLRKSFMIAVLFAVCMIFICSVVTVALCMWGRNMLLPDSDNIYLTLEETYGNRASFTRTFLISLENDKWELPVTTSVEGIPDNANGAITKYYINKIENEYEALSPKRKFAYSFLSANIVIMPILFATFGIFFCALWFYKHKLSKPIRQLNEATGQIKLQNLDFEVKAYGDDELGRLCSSFEDMRKMLYENNQSMWNMYEERKRLQASVSHDLRNPITILQTYTEYLQTTLADNSLTREQLENITQNLSITAKRLEQYTNSIHNISRLEEIKLCPACVNLSEILPEMHEELALLARKNDKKLVVKDIPEDLKCVLDISVLYRILENLVNNSAHYAKEIITLAYSSSDDDITVTVSDDGSGYPQKVLSGKKTSFTTADKDDGHMGLGLAICRILCNKLNGTIKFYNKKDGGAAAQIILKTKKI